MRCVMLAKSEMARGVRAPAAPRANTSEDIAEYLRGCWRDFDRDGELDEGERLGLTEGNWCAAFVSWCLEKCLLEGEQRPHEYRAGVVELVADAKLKGLWHPLEEVTSETWSPHVGDLVIWDRSVKGKPETAWWRHVNRIVAYSGLKDGVPRFVTIGGNESRTIREVDQPPKALTPEKLLGFISYGAVPSAAAVSESVAAYREKTNEERAKDLRLIAAFVEAHRRTLPRG